jgi:hypothetical protein
MSLIDLHTLGLQPAADAQPPSPGTVAAGLRTRDRLVELHVLAEHGDDAAAAEAGEWLRDDPDARYVWEQVEALCGQVRTGAADRGPWRPGLPADDDRRDTATARG